MIILTLILLVCTYITHLKYKAEQEKKGFVLATAGLLGVIYVMFQVCTIISVIITVCRLLFG